MSTRMQVGAALARVMRAESDVYGDPMNDAVGYTPDPSFTCAAVARECGWSLDELIDEAEKRVSEGWAYRYMPRVSERYGVA